MPRELGRRVPVLALLAGVAACCAHAASSPPAASAGRAGASAAAVRIADLSPLSVRGSGFRRLERVRVHVSSGGLERVRRVRATRAGRFRVVFAAVHVDRCEAGVVVRATGGDGSRAVEKLPQMQCPPPLRSPGG